MEIKKITPKQLDEKRKRNDKLFVLDVRAQEKFMNDHIEDSYNIPKTSIFNFEESEDSIKEVLSKSEEIIVTCTTGNSAMKCAKILAEQDYNVQVLEGGLTAWKEYLKRGNF
ncbi:rhodanese-like domain-containing protein [Heyndrickxia oleronia]|uniref:rhodanese-like domain-containing protein n=1 Tax=Heyndrickxia oleronia TaxID=38875 RepID=UPI003F2814BC